MEVSQCSPHRLIGAEQYAEGRLLVAGDGCRLAFAGSRRHVLQQLDRGPVWSDQRQGNQRWPTLELHVVHGEGDERREVIELVGDRHAVGLRLHPTHDADIVRCVRLQHAVGDPVSAWEEIQPLWRYSLGVIGPNGGVAPLTGAEVQRVGSEDPNRNTDQEGQQDETCFADVTAD